MNATKTKTFKNAKKGFTIVSVSLDQNKDAWIKAINDDKHWSLPYEDCGWQSKASEIYGVEFIITGGILLFRWNFQISNGRTSRSWLAENAEII